MKINRLFALLATLASSATLAFGTTVGYTNVIIGDHPVSFWPLNETSGTLIHDVVGPYNGTAINTSGLVLGDPGILYSNGVVTDTSILFKGSPGGSGYIVAPSSGICPLINDPSNLTLEGWFKMPVTFAGGAANLAMITCDTSCPQGFAWMINNANSGTPLPQGWLALHAGWQSKTFLNGTSSGKWVYYAMTYDRATSLMKLYTNGVLALSVSSDYNPSTSFDRGPVLFGAYGESCPALTPPNTGTPSPGRYYQGNIENVAFYNYALTAVQIANHYSAGTNSSGGSVSNPPSILVQPLSQTNFVTQTANFSVTAGGLPPLFYQWMGGTTGSGIYTNLIEGGQFSPVTNSTLSISSLSLGNAGDYVVVVTNSLGSITSSVATLTVLSGAPLITSQPVSSTNYVNQAAGFAVSVSGVAPFTYQWQGGTIGGGIYTNLLTSGQITAVTNATLSISGLTLGNAADFRVIITNVSGSVTSSVATLVVLTNPPTVSYQAAVLADNPVAYWPLQETIGPVIHDVVGTNNGTLFTSVDGAVLTKNQHTNFVTAGAVATDGLSYFLGGPGAMAAVGNDTAIYFTNRDVTLNNSDIVIPYNAAYDPASTFTAEAWVKVPTYPVGYTQNNYQTVFGLEANSGGTQNGWWMNLQTDNVSSKGAFQFNLAKPPGAGWNSPASSAVFSGQWVHAVEVCVGGTNMICYTNGVQMFNTAWPTNNYISEGVGNHKVPFVIGSYCVSHSVGVSAWGFERGNFWHGGVSHVAIYTNALSANRILTHYLSRTNAPAPPTPVIAIQSSGANVVVSWTAGSLQQTAALTDVWTDVTNTSPYTAGPTNATMFFRAKN